MNYKYLRIFNGCFQKYLPQVGPCKWATCEEELPNRTRARLERVEDLSTDLGCTFHPRTMLSEGGEWTAKWTDGRGRLKGCRGEPHEIFLKKNDFFC